MIDFIDTMRDVYLLCLDYSGLERGACIDDEILNCSIVKCGKIHGISPSHKRVVSTKKRHGMVRITSL